MKKSLPTLIYVAITVIIVWAALILQFNISLLLFEGNYLETAKLFLSFFTITTNIIVAVCFTMILLFPQGKAGNFFSKPATLTAITVYIVVVGIIYNFLLRGLLSPTGWARVADELLHVVSPILVLIFWLFATDKSKLAYKDAIIWLFYPLLYVVFIIIRGYFIHQYPYPFINVEELGYPKAILNTIFIIIFFYVLSVIMVYIGRKTIKN